MCIDNTSTVTLKSNIITGNAVYDGPSGDPSFDPVGYGGGLYLANSTAILTNTVITDNQAEVLGNGSGLYIESSAASLLHTTIARNGGGDGSGVYITGTSSLSSYVMLTNTILADHSVGITVAASNTTILNGVLWNNNNMNNGGEGHITVTNAYTGDLAFGTDGYHLTGFSEAIDKGVNAGVSRDIDGHQRPCGSAPDLGADEIYCLYLYLPIIFK
ncbi:MAG: hypothetical protein JSV81_02190 [Anaerolineales bacterium]|nr:MAG: hypothetical protein JSV81_02190 [Anaerolineales bacterium]